MIQIEAMMTVCMNMKKLSFNWMGLLFVQNHICGLVGGGGNQSLGIMILYSIQGVFKVIREGEIVKDIILLFSLA